MTPEQEVALGDYVKLAVRAAAPLLAAAFTIVRGENTPIPALGSAQLRLPASASDVSVESPEYLPNPDDLEGATLLERVTERGRVRAELELRVAAPTTTADSAYHVASRIRRLLGREQILAELEGFAVGLLEVGDVLDIAAFVRESEWESRASLTITVSYALAEDTTIDKIATVEITGTIDPVDDEITVEAPEE
jgi:hypothetical protein